MGPLLRPTAQLRYFNVHIPSEYETMQLQKQGRTFTQLTDRSVISVRGPKSTEFLQKLTTQDMNLFEKREQRASLFTAFLNVKGRVLFDCIVVKPRLAG